MAEQPAPSKEHEGFEVDDNHISTISALVTAISTLPAALVTTYKIVAIVLGSLNILLALAVVVMRVHKTVSAKHRIRILIGGMATVMVISWCLAIFSWHQMNQLKHDNAQTPHGPSGQTPTIPPVQSPVPVTSETLTISGDSNVGTIGSSNTNAVVNASTDIKKKKR